ncbi:hypothetical protein JX266_005574 [Neoarthrinium moseri]|nr:hypothetical protein JX266_005574 [Neoarthrinium moseri]
MYLFLNVLCLLLLGSSISALPSQSLDDILLEKKADSTKVGYLAVYWKTSATGIFFALSTNDNPLGFTELKGGKPVIIPKVGTKVVRDVSIVPGGGKDANVIWRIIGTDLDIGSTTWDRAKRTGSRSIMSWESSDLVNWGSERLVEVEDKTAGMVWAPDAIWDPSSSKYFVHWASAFYDKGDTGHTGTGTPLYIRSALTSDFKTYESPSTYINKSPSDTLDMSFLRVDNSTLVRFLVGAGVKGPVAEVSRNGIAGPWTRPSGSISAQYEGPYPFWDNRVDGKAYLLCDLVGGAAGLRAWSSTDPLSGKFTSASSAITYMRHGSVLPVTQAQYNALKAL